jgi:hypothetical protein
MVTVVVGGGGRGAGKTALICGIMRALPECRWTAVKITSHAHGHSEPVFEETVTGERNDTGRYLAAGARRALLVTAHESGLETIVKKICEDRAQPAHVIFESNSVLRYVRPDLCLVVSSNPRGGQKPSFEMVERCADATVVLGGHDHAIDGERIHFHLKSLERISPPMTAWLHERLSLM